MGLSFMSEHTQSLGSCRSAAALAVLEESVPRARLPWMSMTYIGWESSGMQSRKSFYTHPQNQYCSWLCVSGEGKVISETQATP